MHYKSEKTQVNLPISQVAITRKEEIITCITVEIEKPVFAYKFDHATEIQIIAKVLTGKLSPREGLQKCCEEHYEYGKDINSYPSAVLLRRLGNSRERISFIKGDIFNEMNLYIDNVAQSYNFSL